MYRRSLSSITRYIEQIDRNRANPVSQDSLYLVYGFVATTCSTTSELIYHYVISLNSVNFTYTNVE